MRTFFSKEVHCPVCGTEFEVQKVRTPAIQMEKQDTDFCIHYRTVNPLAYTIWICPRCLYAGEEPDFNSLPRVKATKLQRHILNLFKRYGTPDLSGERDFEKAILSYRIALDWCVFFEKSAIKQASLNLRIAWFYRLSGNEKSEMEYLKKSMELYRKGFETEHSMPKNLGEVGVAYLIGELLRRCGDYQEAVKWFSRVLIHSELHAYPKVERLCRDQWQETKEKAKDEFVEIKELG